MGTIELKQDDSGLIELIRNVTNIHDNTKQAMLDIFISDKELMICYQKEHISLTQYLTEFKARTEVVTRAGGKLGRHPAAVNLVSVDQGLEADILELE